MNIMLFASMIWKNLLYQMIDIRGHVTMCFLFLSEKFHEWLLIFAHQKRCKGQFQAIIFQEDNKYIRAERWAVCCSFSLIEKAVFINKARNKRYPFCWNQWLKRLPISPRFLTDNNPDHVLICSVILSYVRYRFQSYEIIASVFEFFS